MSLSPVYSLFVSSIPSY